MNRQGSLHSPAESWLRWILVATIILLGLYLNRAWMLGLFRSSGLDANAQPREVQPRGKLADDEENTISIFEHISPSVVFVTTVARGYQQTLLGYQTVEIPQGTGSGFVWDSEGRIVTNYHVVQNMNQGVGCIVRFKDGGEHKASLIGWDRSHDIAVLQISASSSVLKPIPVGTSKDLLVGQKVFAIGNPLGYDYTLTTGVISALGRKLVRGDYEEIHDVIQTDAAIGPGSSGGPLLDSSGRLIGMTTAIAGDRYASNIGFAIPVDTINESVTNIIRTGATVRADLGVGFVPDRTMEEIRKLDPTTKGAMVSYVRPGSAAERLGIRPIRKYGGLYIKGDCILSIDGKPIQSTADVFRGLTRHKVGDLVKLVISRDGEEVDIELPLQPIE